MEKQLIVQILVWICGVGVIVAGILYFVSFDSFKAIVTYFHLI